MFQGCVRPVLSILDPTPLSAGRTARDAFAESIALAELADAVGYHRLWVQEHHNMATFAGVAPEVLIPVLAGRTSRIRLGSGGVMLPNYAPLKVAEQFCSLAALFPGRIDLGLGRATGADKRTSEALMGPGPLEFPALLNMLLIWLLDATGEQKIPEGHPASGVQARPLGDRPDVWMLSSSEDGTRFAGQMGLSVAFADFLSPGRGVQALKAYRKAFEPSPFAAKPWGALALTVLAAPTEAEAIALDASRRAWAFEMGKGRYWPVPDMVEAEAVAQMLGDTPVMREIAERAIVGTPDQVLRQIDEVAKAAEADEVLLLTMCHDAAARRRSYALLAEAAGLHAAEPEEPRKLARV
jgi:luciferase family oxidoreductase group 1